MRVKPDPPWHVADAHVLSLAQTEHVVLLLRNWVLPHAVHVLGADMMYARPSSACPLHHAHVVSATAADVHVA